MRDGYLHVHALADGRRLASAMARDVSYLAVDPLTGASLAVYHKARGSPHNTAAAAAASATPPSCI